MVPASLLVLVVVAMLGALVQIAGQDLQCTAYQTQSTWNYQTDESNCTCSWGYYYSDNSTETEGCLPCAQPSDVLNTWLPTSVSGDDASVCNTILTCIEGYYNKPWLGYTLNCQECPNTMEREACERGFARPRCNSTMCMPCNTPALQPTWQYAESAMPPSCSRSGATTQQGCVAYQTPAWDMLVCKAVCKDGYTDISYGANMMQPNCQPCATHCPPGMKGHACPSPTQGRLVLECYDCPANPINTVFTDECQYKCKEGYYNRTQGGAWECVKCVPLPCEPPAITIMCEGTFRGRCQNCSTFLGGFLYWSQNESLTKSGCQYAECSEPELGVTWVAPENQCLSYRDTILSPCVDICSLGFYKKSECTLVSDTECVPCSSTPVGFLTTHACNATADTMWAPCPPGKACYDGIAYSSCPQPRVIQGGRCACPNATQAPSDAAPCLPIACPAGQYPDTSTNTCRSCTLPGTPAAVVTGGVLGIDACACSEQFFKQVLDPYTVRCWPCGKLQCDENTQVQSGCWAEPSCECRIPSGSETYTSNRYCAFSCAEGYINTPQVTFDEKGQRFIFIVTESNALWLTVWNDTLSIWGAPTPLLTNILLHGKGYDAVIDMKLMSHEPFDISNMHSILGMWILWTFDAKNETCGADEYYSQSNNVYISNKKSECTWLLRYIFPTPEQTQTYFRAEGSHYGVALCPPGGFPARANACAVDPGGWAGAQFGTHGARLSRTISASTTLTRLTTPSGAESYEYVIWAGQDSTGVNAVYQYKATFGSNQLHSDAVSIIQVTPCAIRSVAFALNSMYAVLTHCARPNSSLENPKIVQWQTTALFGLRQEYSEVNVVMPSGHEVWGVHATVVPSGIQLGVLTVLGVVMRNNEGVGYLAYVDLLNEYIWPSVMLPQNVSEAGGVLQLDSTTLFVVNQGRELWIKLPQTKLQLCGVDMVSYNGEPCSPVHCRKEHPHGDKTAREFGSSVIGCAEGYSKDAVGVCVICPLGAYCVGGTSASALCPTPSTTTLTRGAKSSADCVCNPGYYTFPGSSMVKCLACDVYHWCPGIDAPPVTCWASGSTLDKAASKPTLCNCPPNTYGLLCTPCPNSSICNVRAQQPTSVVALSVAAWGGVSHGSAIESCTVGVDTVVYPIQTQPLATAENLLMQADGLIAWQWKVVVATSQGGEVLSNITSCLLSASMRAVSAHVDERTALQLNVERSCGLYMEADETSTYCTCVAGYELVITNAGYKICSPCMNGTVRRRWGGTKCTPCLQGSEAGSLGMVSCVCSSGFYRDDTGACVPSPARWNLLAGTGLTVAITLMVLLAVLGFLFRCFI